MRGTLAGLLILAATPALPQFFVMTTDEARQKINKQIKADNGDSLNKCKIIQQDLVCKPDDKSFQRSVKSFKNISQISGRFELREEVSFAPATGKLTTIIMGGDRSNPMALLHFIGQVGSVMKALDPDVNDDRFQDAVRTLGLMGADSDPSIVNSRTDMTKSITITCNSRSSAPDSEIECRVSPRQ